MSAYAHHMCINHKSTKLSIMSSTSKTNTKRWLAIDTDAGIDDSVAICMALKLEKLYDFEVKLITCVQGNCSLEQVAINVAKCREACMGRGSDKPRICLGADKALNGTQVDATFFHGIDGLGDVTDGSIEDPAIAHDDECGIEALVTLAKEAKSMHDVHLTVIALGPLTNIAKAMMQSENQFVELVDEFILMGGCGNARGNITRVAEFNIYNDADAAKYVFQYWNRQTISVASWEYTVQHPLPWQYFDDFLGINNPRHNQVGAFLSKILHKTYGRHEESEERKSSPRASDGAVICDPCAMIYFIEKRTAKSVELVHVDVECQSELTRGMTILDWGSYDGINREKNVKWLMQMDENFMLNILRRICLDISDQA